MGLATAEACYVYIVCLEYVQPGCCGSVSVCVLYLGVRMCEDSTHPFANGTVDHPLSLLSLPLEGGHPLFSKIVKGRKVEGSELFSKENHLCQLHLVPLFSPFEIHVPPPGRLPYTSGGLDYCFSPIGIYQGRYC